MTAVKAYYDGYAFVPEMPVQVPQNRSAIVTILDEENPSQKYTSASDSIDENDPRFKIALEMYKEQRLSMGQAAQVAGVSKVDFDIYLGKHKIPCCFMTYEELQAELVASAKIRASKK